VIEPSRGQTTIPRIIHQSWQNTALPAKLESYRQTVLDVHPDWHYALWTDTDVDSLIQNHYPWARRPLALARLRISKFDMVRYLILHRFGGAYLDLDIEMFVPLDTVIAPGTTAMISRNPADPAHMLSQARHPAWMWMMDHVFDSMNATVYLEDGTLDPKTAFYAAGPAALTDAMASYDATASPEAPRLTRFPMARFYAGCAISYDRAMQAVEATDPKGLSISGLSTAEIKFETIRASEVAATVSCHTDQLCKPLMHSAEYGRWMSTMWGYHHCSGVWWKDEDLAVSDGAPA
jgi:hypothetical protein